MADPVVIVGGVLIPQPPQHWIREVRVGQGSAVIICTCGWNTPNYPTEAQARDRYQYHWEECNGKA